MNDNKKTIGILFFTVFLNLTGFSIILPLSPALLDFYLPQQESAGGLLAYFVQTAKALATHVGQEDSSFITAVFFGCLLASLYAFLQFLFTPVWGKLSDRYGRRKILLITLVGTALSYLFWVVSDTFGLFVLSRVAAGIMAGNITVASAAMADVTSAQKRSHGMALIGVAFGLGFLIGPAMGGLLTTFNVLDYFPSGSEIGLNKYSMPAVVATLLATLNFIWAYAKFPETFPEQKRLSKEKSPSALTLLKMQSPLIAKVNFSYFTFLLCFSGLEFTLAFLAADRFNYSPVNVGCLFLYIGFVLIITQGYIIRKLTPKIGERWIAKIGVLSGIIAFFIIGLSAKLNFFYIGSTFLALSIGLSTPSLSALVSLYADEKMQGKYLGLFRSAGSLARALGPTFAAIFYFLHGATAAYLIVATFLLVPLVLLFLLTDPQKQEDPVILDEELAEKELSS